MQAEPLLSSSISLDIVVQLVGNQIVKSKNFTGKLAVSLLVFT